MIPLERPDPLAQRSAALANVGVCSAGAMTFNVLPVLLGSAADSLALDNAQIGMLASLYLVGGTLVNTSAVLWVRRLDWRRTCAVSGALAAISLGATALISNFAGLVALYLLSGCGAAVMFAVSLTLVADSREPNRYYGITIGSAIFVAVVVLVMLSQLVGPRWGYPGVAAVTATAIGLCALAVVRLPRRGWVREAAAVERDTAAPVLPIAFGLLGVVVFFGALTGLWVFVERLGVVRGYAPEAVALVVSVALVASGVGGLLAGVVSDRFGSRAPLAAGLVLFVVAVLVMWTSRSPIVYGLGAALYCAMWQFVLSYQLGLVALVDRAGRFAVLNAAAMSGGGALGPVVAGWLSRDGGFGTFLLTMTVLASLGVLTSLAVAATKQERTDHG